MRRVLGAATGVRPARGFPQTGAGNISPATDEITVSGFPFPDRSNGRNWSGGERFHRSPAGRGQKGRAAFPVDRSCKRRNRRQELRRVLGAATGVRSARSFPQIGAGNISLTIAGIIVSGFPFPDRSSGRNRSAGNESPGAQRGAAKKAARLFRWTGAGNVGTGGKSCGAFNAPRRAFVQRGDCPKTGAGNMSPAIAGIPVSGFPFPDQSSGRNRSAGNESPGA